MAQTLKDSVRQRILQAAEDALYTQGPSVTMRQIAKAAGVTPGNLYRYYAGKDELLAEVTRPVVQGLDALVRCHTGEQLALGQTDFSLRLSYGPKGLQELRQVTYDMLIPAFRDLCALAGEHPRGMEILCQQNAANVALMNWFYALMQRALEHLVQPADGDGQTLNLLVHIEGSSFCQGVIVLMQECGALPQEQRDRLIRAFLQIHVEGLIRLIEASVESGRLIYKQGGTNTL